MGAATIVTAIIARSAIVASRLRCFFYFLNWRCARVGCNCERLGHNNPYRPRHALLRWLRSPSKTWPVGTGLASSLGTVAPLEVGSTAAVGTTAVSAKVNAPDQKHDP